MIDIYVKDKDNPTLTRLNTNPTEFSIDNGQTAIIQYENVPREGTPGFRKKTKYRIHGVLLKPIFACNLDFQVSLDDSNFNNIVDREVVVGTETSIMRFQNDEFKLSSHVHTEKTRIVIENTSGGNIPNAQLKITFREESANVD